MHWTAHWQGHEALALTAWTRRPDRLADAVSARLLELALEATCLRHELELVAWVVLPGALHVIGAEPGGPLSWPAALGLVKSTWSRWEAERGHGESAWRTKTRVRPLRGDDLRVAIARCHDAPVEAGLVQRPGEHPFSSWHGIGGRARRSPALRAPSLP